MSDIPRLKQQNREQVQGLRKLLLDWNPIGFGVPSDEYDCLVFPILSQLRNGASAEDIDRYLRAELVRHFGLPETLVQVDTAQIIFDWYSQDPPPS